MRDDDELMKIPLFRHVFLAVSERFDRLLDAAKTDQRLAVALCRARSALREENYFRWANIVIDALEQYWDLRHKLGHPPTDNEVLDEIGFHREPGRLQRPGKVGGGAKLPKNAPLRIHRRKRKLSSIMAVIAPSEPGSLSLSPADIRAIAQALQTGGQRD